MLEEFDPYHKWLGISPKDQPPTHYRLLAIDLFESDPDVISYAADKQMAHVRSFQAGQHSALSQKILNEISAAKICLLNSAKKAAYDEQLRTRIDVSLPVARPLKVVPGDPLPEANSAIFEFDAGPVLPKKNVKKPSHLPLAVAALVVAGVFLVAGIVVVAMNRGNDTSGSPQVAAAEANDPLKPSPSFKPGPRPDESTPQPPAKVEPGPAPQPDSVRQPNPVPQPELAPQPDPVRQPQPDGPATSATAVETLPQAKGDSLAQEEERLEDASRAAKTQEDYRTVAEKGLELADRAIVDGNTDLAKKAVRQSLAAARSADSADLAKRATRLLIQLQNDTKRTNP